MADIVVISPTTQEFLGVRYHPGGERGAYYSTRKYGRKLLSRVVWGHHHGNIPHGWQVHHKDEDRGNNAYENLICMAPLDHRREHSWDYSGMARRKFAFVCIVCSLSYEAPRRASNRFCSVACKNTFHNSRRH